MMFLGVLLIAVIVSSQGASVSVGETSDVSGFATCDNEMKLYVDGALVAENNVWPTATAVTFPSSAKVIAIECVDVGVVGGIKAAFNNGVKTDDTWKCSTSVNPGWNNAGYDDSTWASATVASYPGWGDSPIELAGNSDWIWTDGWNGEDLTVYCRKEMNGDGPGTGGYDCDENNPCTSLTPDDIENHRFYYTHISDKKRFIQCSQWGQCYDMPCAPNTIWDQDLYTCVRP